MKLDTVIDISRRKFHAANYDETKRLDIFRHFMMDEMGMTPERWGEVLEKGETTADACLLECSHKARFRLWYFLNYIVDQVIEDL